MVAILRLLIGALRNCFMSRGRLEAEVIVLRHQLNILRRQSPRRVRPNAFDRVIFVSLYRHFPDIGKAVAIIRPETVIRWHRMGFRAWWRWKSRNPSLARHGALAYLSMLSVQVLLAMVAKQWKQHKLRAAAAAQRSSAKTLP